METQNKRGVAIFIACGIAVAVLLGLVVFKMSGTGVARHVKETEFAGQPVAAAERGTTQSSTTARDDGDKAATDTPRADAPDEKTAEREWPATGMVGGRSVYSGGNNDYAGGGVDPLAPRGANLNGDRAATGETSIHRATNAVPSQSETADQGVSTPEAVRTPGPVRTPQAPTPPVAPNEQPAEPQKLPAETGRADQQQTQLPAKENPGATAPAPAPAPVPQESEKSPAQDPAPAVKDGPGVGATKGATADAPSVVDDLPDIPGPLVDAGAEVPRPRGQDPFSASEREMLSAQ